MAYISNIEDLSIYNNVNIGPSEVYTTKNIKLSQYKGLSISIKCDINIQVEVFQSYDGLFQNPNQIYVYTDFNQIKTINLDLNQEWVKFNIRNSTISSTPSYLYVITTALNYNPVVGLDLGSLSGLTGAVPISGTVGVTGNLDVNVLNNIGITGPVGITGTVDVNILNNIGITGPVGITGSVSVSNINENQVYDAFSNPITTTLRPLMQYVFTYENTQNPTPIAPLLYTSAYDIFCGYTGPGITGSTTPAILINNGCLGISDIINSASSNNKCFLYGQSVPYRAGVGFSVMYTCKASQSNKSSTATSGQFLGIGYLDANNNIYDGLGVGYKLSNSLAPEFGIHYYNRGNNLFIPQSAWIDKCDGSGVLSQLNPAYINIYKIEIPYLGAGSFHIYIKNYDTGEGWVKIFTILIENSIIYTSFANPTLGFLVHWQGSNATNLDGAGNISGASFSIFSENYFYETTDSHSINNQKSGITTETSILSIKNTNLINFCTNRMRLKILYICLSNDGGNGAVVYKLRKNATLTGASYINPIDINKSPVYYDIAGTTIVGVSPTIFSIQLGKTDSLFVDLSSYNYYLYVGETFTITGYTGGTSQFVNATIGWAESH